MITRLTMPNLTPNRSFIGKADGGKNPCIMRPSGSDQKVFPYRNCVAYMWARMNETWGAELPSQNAERYFMLAQNNHWITSDKPMIGSCICWAKGSAVQSSDGAGHVAFVEAINSNGSIITSESGWSASKPWWTTTRKSGGRWGQPAGYTFLGFFLPFSPIKKGAQGIHVVEMQHALAVAGYLRDNEIDGDFGRITLGALCGYQLEHGLTVDGIAGAQTALSLGGGDCK